MFLLPLEIFKNTHVIIIIMEEADHQPTKFNMAISTLMRLDRVLNYNTMVSINGDLIKWYDGLFELRRGISPFIKETEFEDIQKKFEGINSKIWLRRGKNRLQVIPSEIGRVYNQLDEVSIIMQRAMNNSGLLMPKSDDPRFALTQ